MWYYFKGSVIVKSSPSQSHNSVNSKINYIKTAIYCILKLTCDEEGQNEPLLIDLQICCWYKCFFLDKAMVLIGNSGSLGSLASNFESLLSLNNLGFDTDFVINKLVKVK